MNRMLLKIGMVVAILLSCMNPGHAASSSGIGSPVSWVVGQQGSGIMAGKFDWIDDVVRSTKGASVSIKHTKSHADREERTGRKGFFYYFRQLLIRGVAGSIGIWIAVKMGAKGLRLDDGDRESLFLAPVIVLALISPKLGILSGIAIGIWGLAMGSQASASTAGSGGRNASEDLTPNQIRPSAIRRIRSSPPPIPSEGSFSKPPPIPDEREM